MVVLFLSSTSRHNEDEMQLGSCSWLWKNPKLCLLFLLFSRTQSTRCRTGAGQWWSCVLGSLHDQSVTAVPLIRRQVSEWARILQEKRRHHLLLTSETKPPFTHCIKRVWVRRRDKNKNTACFMRFNSDSFFEPNKAC